MTTPTPSSTHPPLRRGGRRFVVAAAAVLALVASACGGGDSGDTSAGADPTTGGTSPTADAAAEPTEITQVTLGLPFAGGPGAVPADTSPAGYAFHLGLGEPIFARYGFELTETVGFNNGPPAIEALHSGSVDIVWVGDTPAVASQASGKASRAILVQEPSLDAWFVSREGGPTSIEGFAGKKVGLQFGSNFDKFGRALLTEAGVLDEVELVNIPFPDALPALQRGDIDGYAIIATLGGIWVKNNPGLQVLAKASDGDGTQLTTAVVIVTPSFLDEHPDIQDAWWEVYQAGVAEIEKDPDAYIAFVAETTNTPPDVVKQATILNFGDAPVTERGLAALNSGLEFLVAIGNAKEAFDISEWVVEPNS